MANPQPRKTSSTLLLCFSCYILKGIMWAVAQNILLYFYLLQIQGLMLAVNELFSADKMVRRYLFRLNPCKLYDRLENIFHTYLERIFHFWKQYFIPTRSVIVPCFSAHKHNLFNSLDLFSFDRRLAWIGDQTRWPDIFWHKAPHRHMAFLV